MIYKVIAVILISCLAGIKKPIYGGLAGMITAPGISILLNSFDLPTVVFLAPFGFGFGLMFGVLAWKIFHGSEYNKESTKPYIMPMSRNIRGGIIYTDEEEKNSKENKKI